MRISDRVTLIGITSVLAVFAAGCLVNGISIDSFREAFDALGVVVLSIASLLVLRRVPRIIDREVPWTLVAAIVIALLLHAMGVYLRLYELLDGRWDVVTHLTSSVVVALIGYRIIEGTTSLTGSTLPVRMMLLGTIAFAAMAGIVWEFAEMACDELIGTGMQYAKYMDTNIDLLADLVGGTIAAASVAIASRQPSTHRSNDAIEE